MYMTSCRKAPDRIGPNLQWGAGGKCGPKMIDKPRYVPGDLPSFRYHRGIYEGRKPESIPKVSGHFVTLKHVRRYVVQSTFTWASDSCHCSWKASRHEARAHTHAHAHVVMSRSECPRAPGGRAGGAARTTPPCRRQPAPPRRAPLSFQLLHRRPSVAASRGCACCMGSTSST